MHRAGSTEPHRTSEVLQGPRVGWKEGHRGSSRGGYGPIAHHTQWLPICDWFSYSHGWGVGGNSEALATDELSKRNKTKKQRKF